MTAFARMQSHDTWGQAVWELRSVNHRYLDLSFKVPESFRQWETAWRQVAANFVQRGKVEIHLSFMPSEETLPVLEVNEAMVAQLIKAMNTVEKFPGIQQNAKALDILRWPEVLSLKKADMTFLERPLTALLEKTFTELVAGRNREGTELAKVIKQRLEQTEAVLHKIIESLPESNKNKREKLLLKLQELPLNVDPQRLEQEIVLIIQRSDIAEEIDRLKAHLKEVRKTLTQDEAIGRRLDFLMQELNREANTLAAKALDEGISEKAVTLKVLIEQMREQIQNVE